MININDYISIKKFLVENQNCLYKVYYKDHECLTLNNYEFMDGKHIGSHTLGEHNILFDLDSSVPFFLCIDGIDFFLGKYIYHTFSGICFTHITNCSKIYNKTLFITDIINNNTIIIENVNDIIQNNYSVMYYINNKIYLYNYITKKTKEVNLENNKSLSKQIMAFDNQYIDIENKIIYDYNLDIKCNYNNIKGKLEFIGNTICIIDYDEISYYYCIEHNNFLKPKKSIKYKPNVMFFNKNLVYDKNILPKNTKVKNQIYKLEAI